MTLWKKCNVQLVLVLILLTGVGVGGGVAEEHQLNEWRYSKEVIVEGSNAYKTFFLDEEIYEHALHRLEDLRILDDKGEIVPYYIQSGYLDQDQSKISFQSYVVHTGRKNNDTFVDFQIRPTSQNTDIVGNELVFTLPNQNFLKHIVIEGSYDGNQWNKVISDHLYKADHLEKNRVLLGDIYKYSYYRITVKDNIENIILSEVALLNNQQKKEWHAYQKSTVPTYKITTEEKHTTIEVQNPQQLKINEIELEIGENFQRSFLVYDEDEHLVLSEESELYNLDFTNVKISNTNIVFSNQPLSSRVLTVKINNQDNPPLKINSVNIAYYVDKLVFIDSGSSSYSLFYGNADATKPTYDLEQYKEHLEMEVQDQVTLGDKKIRYSNLDEAADSWLNMKYVFNIVIVLVSFLLAFLLTRKLNRK